MQKVKNTAGTLNALTETQAAQAMWDYYKAHKPDLIADIRIYRDYILAQLVLGRAADEVFAQFIKKAAPVLKAHAKRTRSKHQVRAPWPFATY